MTHILLTGGAGFIGSNLSKTLLASGEYHITCLDNFDDFYSRSQKQFNLLPLFDHPRFTLIEGDIRNAQLLDSIPGHIDCIIHLAAKAGVRPSISNPVLYQDANTGGTQVMLEFAHKRGIRQFVFASSSSVYGVNEQLPWQESEILQPISPYAASKLAGEMLGHVYSHLYDVRFLALRFFTVYGPGQRPDLAIHKFFDSITHQRPIPVYGDGTTRRDYTYVADIIQGIIAAINYQSSDFEIINLGNHQTVQLETLIGAIESETGSKAIIDRQPEQPGDVPATYASIEKAGRLLNYHPVTRLEDGLRQFHEWYRGFNQWKRR